MNTQKHDSMMIRHVPVTVGELAELAHEANALQADVVREADAHRVTRDRLADSNEARHVLVTELAQLDVWRETAEALRSQLDTVRQQLTTERSKHAKATGHIANMATGRGWLPGKVSPITEVINAVTRAEADRRQLVGVVQERSADALAQAVDAELTPLATPEVESRPFKVGDRVEVIQAALFSRTPVGARGVIERANGNTFAVRADGEVDSNASWFSPVKLRHVDWEPGEGIEVGAEVEYVGNDQGRIMFPDRMGKRGTVTRVGNESVYVDGELTQSGVLKINLRRIS